MATEEQSGVGPLGQLAQEINQINEEKGWNENIADRREGEWCMLEVTEIAEALEAYREGQPLFWLDQANGCKPEGAAVERIDCIIRILHWFAAHGIDPDEVMKAKLDYNRTRPYRHGGKKL